MILTGIKDINGDDIRCGEILREAKHIERLYTVMAGEGFLLAMLRDENGIVNTQPMPFTEDVIKVRELEKVVMK